MAVSHRVAVKFGHMGVLPDGGKYFEAGDLVKPQASALSCKPARIYTRTLGPLRVNRLVGGVSQ